MRLLVKVFLACFLFFCTTTLSFADSQYDGWWFAPQFSGSGISLAINGDTIFAAMYTYDNDGKPLWYTMSAQKTQGEGEIFSGDMLYWLNGNQDFLPSNPQPHKAGTMTLEFLSPTSAKLTYQNTDIGTGPITLDLIPFMPTVAPGESDARVKGWWYDPEYDGMGVFIEAQGGTLFGAWYHYMLNEQSETGATPSWSSFSGPFADGATTFSSPLLHWSGGSILGLEPYIPPSALDTGFAVTLNVNDDGTIDAGVGPPDDIPLFWIKLRRFTF